MTTEQTKPTAESKTAAPKSKKSALILIGGAAGIIALAFVVALLGVPAKKKQKVHHIEGPFVADISPPNGFQVNLAGRGGKHYLAMSVRAEVDAFQESYATQLTADALYQAKLTDAVLKVASRKTKDDLDDTAGKDFFREELRIVLDPVLFPVHVGSEKQANARHPESGLRPGISIARASMRGLFYEHELEVDGAKRTIRLDGGEPTSFAGEETDLEVQDSSGRSIFLDVTGVDPGYHGKLHVGVMGRVRNIYFNSFLTQ